MDRQLLPVQIERKKRPKRKLNPQNKARLMKSELYGLSKEEVFQRINKRDDNDIERLQRIYNINLNQIITHLDLQLENTKKCYWI